MLDDRPTLKNDVSPAFRIKLSDWFFLVFLVQYKHFLVFFWFLLVLLVQSQDFEDFLPKYLVFLRFSLVVPSVFYFREKGNT